MQGSGIPLGRSAFDLAKSKPQTRGNVSAFDNLKSIRETSEDESTKLMGDSDSVANTTTDTASFRARAAARFERLSLMNCIWPIPQLLYVLILPFTLLRSFLAYTPDSLWYCKNLTFGCCQWRCCSNRTGEISNVRNAMNWARCLTILSLLIVVASFIGLLATQSIDKRMPFWTWIVVFPIAFVFLSLAIGIEYKRHVQCYEDDCCKHPLRARYARDRGVYLIPVWILLGIINAYMIWICIYIRQGVSGYEQWRDYIWRLSDAGFRTTPTRSFVESQYQTMTWAVWFGVFSVLPFIVKSTMDKTRGMTVIEEKQQLRVDDAALKSRGWQTINKGTVIDYGVEALYDPGTGTRYVKSHDQFKTDRIPKTEKAAAQDGWENVPTMKASINECVIIGWCGRHVDTVSKMWAKPIREVDI